MGGKYAGQDVRVDIEKFARGSFNQSSEFNLNMNFGNFRLMRLGGIRFAKEIY